MVTAEKLIKFWNMRQDETMINEQKRFFICLIYLMRDEIQCLRSVVSEYEADPCHFTQWMRAQDIRRVIEGMEHLL